MADTIEAELIVTAIAKGFDSMGKAITGQAEAQRALDKETRKATEAARAEEKAFREQEKAIRDQREEYKKWGEGAGQALEIIGKGLDYAAAASERLGRSELPDAMAEAESATQRLGDSLLELPMGKVNLLYQAFGDETLKNADAITILTRGMQGITNTMKAFSAASILAQANLGIISWDDAAQQAAALNAEVEKGADDVDEYAAHWAGLAATMGETAADKSIAKWLEMREAEVGAGRLATMKLVAQSLAAGLGGDVSNAQQTYNDTVADSNGRIAEMQEKMAGLNKWSRDYKSTVDELNGAIAEQTTRQLDAAAALELANKQFVFQQAAANLDEQGQLALAFSMGLIDEASYNASLRVIALTEAFDENNDGVVDLAEGQTDYINALTYTAETLDGTTTPAVIDHKDALLEAEKAMGDAGLAAGAFNDDLSEIPDNKTIVIDTVYTSTGTPPPAFNGQGGSGPGTAYAAGGDFVVPPGYPNDSAVIRVQSGERVTVQTPGQQMQNAMSGGNSAYNFGAVNIYAQPGQDGAALFQEFSAAAAAQVRAQRNTGN
jgi:hypothetical protein